MYYIYTYVYILAYQSLLFCRFPRNSSRCWLVKVYVYVNKYLHMYRYACIYMAAHHKPVLSMGSPSTPCYTLLPKSVVTYLCRKCLVLYTLCCKRACRRPSRSATSLCRCIAAQAFTGEACILRAIQYV